MGHHKSHTDKRRSTAPCELVAALAISTLHTYKDVQVPAQHLIMSVSACNLRASVVCATRLHMTFFYSLYASEHK